VTHTGPLTWLQRAWIAVLALHPAALAHRSAIRAADGPGRAGSDDEVIHVAVDRDRSPAAPAGVRLHRLADLDEKVQWNASPPRVRIEHAVVDVAAQASDEITAIATLADAVQSRRTTARRLLAVVAARRRIARRALLTAVLGDVASGVCSALEHGYLDRVERRHGLPVADRQVRASLRGPVLRDVEYLVYRLVVELDSRLFHNDARSRDRDLDRDLDAAVAGRTTVRIGWGQVYGRGCETAARIGLLLQQRGWTGRVTPCPRCATTALRYAGATG
jgi:hypothetical protein